VNKKIVIIDPDSNVTHLLAHLFKQQGIKTICYISAGQAAKSAALFCTEEVGLVILERSLPDMDGIALASTILKKKGYPPFLFLSMLNTVEERQKGLQAGAKDYVGKPFDPEAFVSKALKVMR
jgi:DNA-binding response OmpR family regulator